MTAEATKPPTPRQVLEGTTLGTEARDRLKALIYGLPGTGKTVLGCSIGECDEVKKILFVDISGERGYESVVNMGHAAKVQVIHITNPAEITTIQHALNTGNHDYDAVVLDSISALESLFIRYANGIIGTDVFDLNPEPQSEQQRQISIRMWGNAKQFMVEQLQGWFNMGAFNHPRPIHVIFLSQATWLERAGAITECMVPNVRPKTVGDTLSAPDHILYTYVEDASPLGASDPVVRHKVQLKQTESIYAKVHTDPDTYAKMPITTGGESRLTLPDFCRQLQIPLS